MTPHEAVRGAAGPVGRLGGAFMFDPATAARGEELGFRSWSYYHLGRGGALGDVEAVAVVAAFGFFPPDLQTKAWVRGCEVMPPREAAREYAADCARYGSDHLGGFPSAARLAELLTAVTDAAQPMGLPLFAGWRALVRELEPVDAGARLGLALQVARELRGGAHLLAVRAQGVEPLQAVMSGRYGAVNAELFGWPQPWPDPEAAREQMAAAEALTDRLVEPALAALAEPERAELVALLRELQATQT